MPGRHETSGGAEPAYRAYAIGEDGRVVTSDVIVAATDDAALARMREIAEGRRMELWDRGRLVARQDATGISLL